MKGKQTPFLLFAVLGGIGILFIMQFVSLVWTYTADLRIAPGEVRGVTLYHENTAYTLGFDQQNTLVKHINSAVTVKTLPVPPSSNPEGISRIVIHRFGENDIVMTPVAIDDGNTYFTAPFWVPQGYLLDVTGTHLASLLASTHD